MNKIENVLQQMGDKIADVTRDLTVLKIQTVMGVMEKDTNGKVAIQNDSTVKGMISKIDLIDGDIETEISEDFYKSYPELVQFHQSRELKGHEIIQNNINTLKNIVSALKDMKSDLG